MTVVKTAVDESTFSPIKYFCSHFVRESNFITGKLVLRVESSSPCLFQEFKRL